MSVEQPPIFFTQHARYQHDQTILRFLSAESLGSRTSKICVLLSFGTSLASDCHDFHQVFTNGRRPSTAPCTHQTTFCLMSKKSYSILMLVCDLLLRSCRFFLFKDSTTLAVSLILHSVQRAAHSEATM